MCSGGVDLFPLHDACCYIDGATPKHRAAEDHLYHCMALLSTGHSFAWSRWNLLAGRCNMVLQMKETLEKRRQVRKLQTERTICSINYALIILI
jgi:cancer susceptibility candidate protein 1